MLRLQQRAEPRFDASAQIVDGAGTGRFLILWVVVNVKRLIVSVWRTRQFYIFVAANFEKILVDFYFWIFDWLV